MKSEIMIIKGLKDNINLVKYIYFEHHFDQMIVKNYTFRDINQLLLKAGFKKVFKISIDGATDISDPANGANGKLYGANKTVEELNNQAGLQGAGITPVSKTLVLDLLKDLPAVYPHDKAEGLALLPGNILAISNDDDFGVVDNSKGGFAAKILPATNTVDHNRIYFVKIKL